MFDPQIDYEAFAQALVEILDLRSDVMVFPYVIEINPKGQLDGALLVWLLAHATLEQVAEAERRARVGPSGGGSRQ